jgi:hypothetical protein
MALGVDVHDYAAMGARNSTYSFFSRVSTTRPEERAEPGTGKSRVPETSKHPIQ